MTSPVLQKGPTRKDTATLDAFADTGRCHDVVVTVVTIADPSIPVLSIVWKDILILQIRRMTWGMKSA